jgi:hypothetical protein
VNGRDVKRRVTFFSSFARSGSRVAASGSADADQPSLDLGRIDRGGKPFCFPEEPKKNPYALRRGQKPSFARSRGIRSAAMAPKSESRGWCMLLMLVIFEGVAVIAALVAVTGTFWLGARDP